MITLEDIIIGIFASIICVKAFDTILDTISWLLDKCGEWDRAHNPKSSRPK